MNRIAKESARSSTQFAICICSILLTMGMSAPSASFAADVVEVAGKENTGVRPRVITHASRQYSFWCGNNAIVTGSIYRDVPMRLYTVKTDQIAAIGNNGEFLPLACSSDGRWLVYRSQQGSKNSKETSASMADWHAMDLLTGKTTGLGKFPGGYRRASFSPDAKFLLIPEIKQGRHIDGLPWRLVGIDREAFQKANWPVSDTWWEAHWQPNSQAVYLFDLNRGEYRYLSGLQDGVFTKIARVGGNKTVFDDYGEGLMPTPGSCVDKEGRLLAVGDPDTGGRPVALRNALVRCTPQSGSDPVCTTVFMPTNEMRGRKFSFGISACSASNKVAVWTLPDGVKRVGSDSGSDDVERYEAFYQLWIVDLTKRAARKLLGADSTGDLISPDGLLTISFGSHRSSQGRIIDTLQVRTISPVILEQLR